MAQHAEANADAKLAGRTIVEAAPQAARTVTRETGRQGAREVFGYMGVAVVFALIGNEIRQAKHGKGTTSPGTLSESGVIIFGGFTAASRKLATSLDTNRRRAGGGDDALERSRLRRRRVEGARSGHRTIEAQHADHRHDPERLSPVQPHAGHVGQSTDATRRLGKKELCQE